jgi:hypothetical protein
MKSLSKTIADAREDKKFEDVLADHKAKKLKAKNQETINFLQSEIEKAKEDIIDCLEQNLFSFAKSKIERIEILKIQINSIK